MKRSGKERSQRQLRVSQNIKRVLSEYLHREYFSDPALQDAGAITVGEIMVSPDLRHATAYVSSLNQNDNIDAIVEALNKVAPGFSHYVAKNLETKNTPKISFDKDPTVALFDKINTLLD